MKRIRKEDNVIVTAGKSKGHLGKVLKVLGQRVIVEGANLMHKHVKPNPNTQQKGGVVAMEAALDISNVALVNPATNKADKVGFRFIEKDGSKIKVRYFKSNNELIDVVK